MPARQADEIARLRQDGSGGRRSRNGHSTPAAELEQTFVPKRSESAQDGIGVDPEDGREVTSRRQSLAGPRLSLGDRATDFCGHLLVEIDGLATVNLDNPHGASHGSTIGGWPCELRNPTTHLCPTS
jgi:hypothetical protein